MLIILDRDGVINKESDAYIKTPEEWHALPGSLEAISKLNRAGHTVVIATNQSGVGRGYYDETTLNKIHKKMADELMQVSGHIDHIYYCPHHPDDNCACRKPKPGMLIEIAKDLNEDLKNAIFIGDSARDIYAAQAAGCPAALVLSGNGNKDDAEVSEDVPRFKDLADAANTILKK